MPHSKRILEHHYITGTSKVTWLDSQPDVQIPSCRFPWIYLVPLHHWRQHLCLWTSRKHRVPCPQLCSPLRILELAVPFSLEVVFSSYPPSSDSHFWVETSALLGGASLDIQSTVAISSCPAPMSFWITNTKHFLGFFLLVNLPPTDMKPVGLTFLMLLLHQSLGKE